MEFWVRQNNKQLVTKDKHIVLVTRISSNMGNIDTTHTKHTTRYEKKNVKIKGKGKQTTTWRKP
jgi:flagellar basal body rod protein FlgC